MAKNRKAAEALMLKYAAEVDKSGANLKMYERGLKQLTDEDFDKLMKDFADRKEYFHIVDPNAYNDTNISLEHLQGLLKKHGVKLFERMTIYEEDGAFTPVHTFNIMLLPVTRLGQHQSTGMSIPANNHKRNPITNQVTGSSKGGSIALPEIYILNGLGLDNMLEEVLGARGGNSKALAKMERDLEENGVHYMSSARGGVTTATSTLRAYFNALHLEIK